MLAELKLNRPLSALPNPCLVMPGNLPAPPTDACSFYYFLQMLHVCVYPLVLIELLDKNKSLCMLFPNLLSGYELYYRECPFLQGMSENV